MIRRRRAAASISSPIGCHTFRATGITAYSPTAARSSTRRKYQERFARDVEVEAARRATFTLASYGSGPRR